MNHIIFDFDGVLADSFEFHLKKINDLFGIGLTAQEYKDMHNGNFYNHPMLKKMSRFKSQDYPDLVAAEQAQLPLSLEVKILLERLSKNHKLHIISSGWERQIVPFLQNHKIETLFTELLFADHGKLKSEKFKGLLERQKTTAKNCIFISDTLGDIYEAKQLDIPTIAVTFGFHDKQHLQKGSPAYVGRSWPEIEAQIAKHFS